MWSIFITAIGFVFVVEGVLPFLSPPHWRRFVQQMFIQSDVALRIVGLASMLVGLLFVCVARDFY